jgi:hypothetical protein
MPHPDRERIIHLYANLVEKGIVRRPYRLCMRGWVDEGDDDRALRVPPARINGAIRGAAEGLTVLHLRSMIERHRVEPMGMSGPGGLRFIR